MDNPFVFGKIVVGSDFWDRQRERAELRKYLIEGVRVFLVSPRRYGKTSLIRDVLGSLSTDRRRKVIAVYVNLERANSPGDASKLFLSALARAVESKPERLVALAKSLFARLRPVVILESDGTPRLSFDIASEQFPVLPEALTMAQAAAKRTGRLIAVALDEFQMVLRWNGEAMEGQLRAVIQEQKSVGYVFAGSQTRLLSQMATHRERPFYQSGPVMFLKTIPPELLLPPLVERFARKRLKVDEAALISGMEKVGWVPYYVQALSWDLWDVVPAGGKIDARAIQAAFDRSATRTSSLYERSFSELTDLQRRVLIALAHGVPEGLSAEVTRRTFALGSPSGIAKALSLLEQRGHVERHEAREWRLSDPFFAHWLRREFPV